MLAWLKRNAQIRRIGHDVYEGIVAASRREAFFRDWSVPDTMLGRFAMIVVHVFVVLERLKREGEPGQRLGQAVLERLVADMDDALRQIGIGDMGVPRRIKKTAGAIREHIGDYSRARQGTDDLEVALLRHVFGLEPDAKPTPEQLHGSAQLARYVRASLASVDRQTFEGLCSTGPVFTAP